MNYNLIIMQNLHTSLSSSIFKQKITTETSLN